MKSASATTFDEAYYQRFYFDKKTSVADPAHIERTESSTVHVTKIAHAMGIPLL